ncbi:hypothetical protein HA402_006162 [Bradysia odoriphaga]|nr:hypothetical protein HA402_006162 [Bradysia odoriphaga]
MKYLIVLIFLGIVIESMIVTGQRLDSDSDNSYDEPSSAAESTDDIGYRRPTNNFNGRFKKVLKVKKERPNQEPLPVGKRLNRTPNSEDSVSASSNKNSFTVSNYDDNDDYFSRRRARFLFRQRVGK